VKHPHLNQVFLQVAPYKVPTLNFAEKSNGDEALKNRYKKSENDPDLQGFKHLTETAKGTTIESSCKEELLGESFYKEQLVWNPPPGKYKITTHLTHITNQS